MDAVIHVNFKKQEDRQKITNSSHEENLNRPRGIIIISSYDKLVNNYQIKNREKIIRDFTKLRNSVHNIEILTFDEILGIAHDYIQNIITKNEEVLQNRSNSLNFILGLSISYFLLNPCLPAGRARHRGKHGAEKSY